MFRLYGLLTIAYLALLVYTVLNVILTDATLIRNLPKVMWLLLLLLLGPVGVMAWYIAGRPLGASIGLASGRSRGSGAGRGAPSRGNPRRRPPPKGPDDDPAFMRSLNAQLRPPGPVPEPEPEPEPDLASDTEPGPDPALDEVTDPAAEVDPDGDGLEGEPSA
jgi:hypothetical protein